MSEDDDDADGGNADSASGDATTSAAADEVADAWHGTDGGDSGNDDASPDSDDW